MPPIFESLLLLDERHTPGCPAWNMALDEALLTNGRGPLLRLYSWDEPAVSFGYFLPYEAAREGSGERPLVRRWTGGGIVEHGQDFTWSLIVPATHPASRLRPSESYVLFHAALAESLQTAGNVVQQVGPEFPAPRSGHCMTAPAPGDLIYEGRKIAGAGQRRCRHGVLHQGSLSGVSLPVDFPHLLASALSGGVRDFPREDLPAEEARKLMDSRYGTEGWLRMR